MANDSGKRAGGNAWGDDIPPERQAELEQRLQEWEQEAEHGERKGPFDSTGISDEERATLKLNGADVFWLAARTLSSPVATETVAGRTDLLRRARTDVALWSTLRLDSLHLERADLTGAHLERAILPGAHLEGAVFNLPTFAQIPFRLLPGGPGPEHFQAHLEEADFNRAHLEGADLNHAHLERIDLRAAHLEGANLSMASVTSGMLGRAHLEGANLSYAHLERTDFWEAHLEGADLSMAYLEVAFLNRGVHLEGANLSDARLGGADLHEAHLEGAKLSNAHLEGTVYQQDDTDYRRLKRWVEDFPSTLAPADLRGVFLDNATALNDASLGTSGHAPGQGYVPVADVRWGGANLAVIKDWPSDMVLGDESAAWAWQPPKRESADQLNAAATKRSGKEEAKARREQDLEWQREQAWAQQDRLDRFRAAVRANRQLATALREQGMNEEADHFAYRAQVCQRRLFRLQRQWGRWFLQSLLAVLAGYGFRLGRIFAAYALVVGLFAVAFLASGLVTSQSAPTVPQAFDALQISLNAIHGRVFFAQFHLDTVQSWLATAESIVGIVIEGVFVAMLVQRFFGGK